MSSFTTSGAPFGPFAVFAVGFGVFALGAAFALGGAEGPASTRAFFAA